MSLISLTRETIGWKARDVLVDIDLHVEPGERIAFLGRSGSGKSTLITHLYRRLTAAGKAVSLIPQDHALVPPLSVFHNVYMGQLDRRSTFYSIANLIKPLKKEVGDIRPILSEISLEPEIFQSVEKLSGGQKQRTAIARAFFRGGEIILGDEPVSAIDEKQSARVLEAIRSRFQTALLALHNVDLARTYCDRIIGLKGNKIVIDAPAKSIERADIDSLYAA
ncbi:MAG: ATP-binding cassette domain-containing protein [Rhizobiales bacterium]|nr:ATP-binding cassette domain-containing protein [Hyphomicrobiales bacterium]